VNQEPSLRATIQMLARSRLLILALAGAGCAIGWAVSWLATPRYRAEVTLLPRQDAAGSTLLSHLTGAASLPLDFGSRPEDLYGAILRSNTVLDAVLTDPQDGNGLYERLTAALGWRRTDGRMARYELRQKLQQDLLSFSRDRTTGVMTVEVDVPRDRALAAVLANALADSLDRFVTRRHERRGLTRRDFIQARLAEIERELHGSRAALTEFVTHNRSYADSPELRQRYDELASEIQAIYAVWIEVRRQLEMARIEMHGDLTTIEILDRAEVPWRRSFPNRALWAAFGLTVGAVIGIGAASWRDAGRR
jgi:tyrosine-protein kinase Etk/Wzc